MPGIGNTLREARIRQKVDITAVEQATKIRAKYLRALETEEFDSLPGPTFVKTFIRAYAEYLGLDAQLLISEYRNDYEPRVEQEPLHHMGEPPKGRERIRPRSFHPALVGAVALVIIVVVLLFVLGLLSK